MTGRGRLTSFDFLLWAALAAAIGVLAAATGANSEFPPELWDEFAVAAGLRPSATPIPLLWHRLVSLLISGVGVERSVSLLKISGPVVLAVLAFMSCALFSGCQPPSMRFTMNRFRRGRRISAAVTVCSVLFFVCSEPVWLAARIFSPELFLLCLTVASLLCAIRAFSRSSLAWCTAFGALSGVIAAATPVAFIAPMVFTLHLRSRKWDDFDEEEPALADPFVQFVAVRRIVVAFVAAWAVVAVANMFFFSANGGDAGEGVLQMAFCYFRGYAHYCINALSLGGVLLMLTIAVLPVAVSFKLASHATDTSKFLTLGVGAFMAAAGIVAVLQSMGFASCHFWRWISKPEPVSNVYLLCLSLLATSLVSMFALCTLSVETFLRNKKRLVRAFFPEANDGGGLPLELLKSFKRSSMVLLPLWYLLVIAATVAVLLPKLNTVQVEMSKVVNDAVAEIALECGDSRYLFTDGAMDGAIECAAAIAGHDLKAISLMSGSSKYDTKLRERGETDETVKNLLRSDASGALRTWVRNGSPQATNIALYAGFELWRHENLPMPKCSGMVARTAGFPPGEAEKGIERAHAFAERIVGLQDMEDLFARGYPSLNRLLSFVQWRLSRMCRTRASVADSAGKASDAEREHALADRLDRSNPYWQELQKRIDWMGRRGESKLTPREGLKLGLDRADFRMAMMCARQILPSEPDDLHANFAMGMGHFTERQYGRAEEYLRRCLKRAPDEPAVLNNLAIALLRQNRFAEAESFAAKALERLPDSAEIKSTLRHIRKAIEERKNNRP